MCRYAKNHSEHERFAVVNGQLHEYSQLSAFEISDSPSLRPLLAKADCIKFLIPCVHRLGGDLLTLGGVDCTQEQYHH
ncbi:hypothetical protein VTK73DRAFT_3233 [Phialemonium thermophilum]|uniref:Uncharacterized protein n=1 Tax=Phialemonium thermophilum TaxID=223376 RepID=A0ABR3Y891_9PEZI